MEETEADDAASRRVESVDISGGAGEKGRRGESGVTTKGGE